MIKIRNKIFARRKRQPNNENIKRLYNLFRNRVSREFFEDNKMNIKNIWSGIREIVNTKLKTS